MEARRMIRSKVSDLLEVRIQEGRWEAYTLPLDREGKFTRKTLIGLVMVICEALEDQEKQIAEMNTRAAGLKDVVLKIEKELRDGQKTKRDPKVSV